MWISATAIILDILGAGANPEKIWFSDYEKIQKARQDERVDIELERRVTALAQRQDGLLLDTWAMAYIYTGPLLRIWIESDEDSRTRKCYLSLKDKRSPLDSMNADSSFMRKIPMRASNSSKSLDLFVSRKIHIMEVEAVETSEKV